MTLRRTAAHLSASLTVGALIAALASIGTSGPTAGSARGACFSALRLLRHAVSAYDRQHGRLPGSPSGGEADPSLLARQLTEPRNRHGDPDPAGPFPGLLAALPVNPYTGSSAFVVVPEDDDVVAFAAASTAGWAYVARPGRDAAGPLPAGFMLPCGEDAREPGGKAIPLVQRIAFEIEDYEPWR